MKNLYNELFTDPQNNTDHGAELMVHTAYDGELGRRITLL